MKIHIFQRHCGFSSQSQNKPRPEWFSREKCFNNLNIIPTRKLNVLYDRTDLKRKNLINVDQYLLKNHNNHQKIHLIDNLLNQDSYILYKNILIILNKG